MKYALVNPNWTHAGSDYFGCRDPQLCLEFGYATALLEQAGHEALLVDAHLEDLSDQEVKSRVAAFKPDFAVLTTAPTYLFWRCAPPELKKPLETAALLRDAGGLLVAVGPHGSATPGAVMRKLGCDVVVLGECEEVLPLLAGGPSQGWESVPSVAYRRGGRLVRQGGPFEARLDELPALHWPDEIIGRHAHHHRFDAVPEGLAAEMETSRGCPFTCAFCAKEFFRTRYRLRPLSVILEELDGLLAQGVTYVCFVDEIFLPDERLLTELAERPVHFGIQTRIDLWSESHLALLGLAGCVSMEVGLEAVTEAGRARLGKRMRMPTSDMTRLLLAAKRHVPFVQANLLRTGADDHADVLAWREDILAKGLWANEPVPVFPYPGTLLYEQLFGPVDDQAWERAHDYYLRLNIEFSDIQSSRPEDLGTLEEQTGEVGA